MSQRSYSVGIPLTVTISANGAIDFDFDLSEVPLHESNDQSSEPYDDDAVIEDQAVLDIALAAVRNSLAVSL